MRKAVFRPMPDFRMSRLRSSAVERLVPLHYQVYMTLRRRLLEGEFAPDSPLPSEHQLAADFKVSRVTIRRTLARLEDEGLVLRRHGIGTFPGDLAAKSGSAAPIGSLRERLVGPDSERRNLRLLSFARVAPPPRLQVAGLRFGRKVLRIQRLSLHGSRPTHLVTSHVPGDFAALLQRDRLGNQTVLELLEAAGIRIGEAEVTITAAAADVVVAERLAVPVGAPVLVAMRLTRDTSGRPVEYFEGISRPDEYSFQFVVAKPGAKGRPLPWRGPA